MPELITIEEAARITGFPSEDIQYWAKSHKITSYSVTRDSRLVDLPTCVNSSPISNIWEYRNYTCN